MPEINKDRLVNNFIKYTSIDSESFHEKNFADELKKELLELGFEFSEDNAGELLGGNQGNIHGLLKGSLNLEPVLFSGHMDTVIPGNGKKPKITEDGKIVSESDTVLGADDVCSIAGILEAVRAIKESGLPHRDIEVLFFVAEEKHCLGSKVFDIKKIQSKDAYIFDLSGAPGKAAIQAPSSFGIKVRVFGRAAHSGFCPEKGINAIKIMAEAITKTKQGKLTPDTSRNIGVIKGGRATNIVSAYCECLGEVRSFSQEEALDYIKEMKEIFEETGKRYGLETFEKNVDSLGDEEGAVKTKPSVNEEQKSDTEESDEPRIEFLITQNYKCYKISKESSVIKRFEKACGNLEMKPELVPTFGGSDNNWLTNNGINGVVLSCGMEQVHSVDEYVYVEDLYNTARLAAELMMTK